MATSYRPRVLPVVPCVRSFVLATLASEGASVYQRSDDPTDGAEVRETWPDGTAGLSATPADPEAAGWTRLTPAPT